MNTKPDIRGYVNPRALGLTESGQREGMNGEVYVEDRRGHVVDALIKSVRNGSVIAVRELYYLAPGDFRPQKRRRLLTERVEAIKAAGGSILELATGYSSKEGHLPRMLLTAYEQIATSGRARKRDRTGRPAREWTAHELEVMEAIWNSRRYSNDEKRVTAIRANIGKTPSRSWLRLKFGGTS
jgi:hypothetical protein